MSVPNSPILTSRGALGPLVPHLIQQRENVGRRSSWDHGTFILILCKTATCTVELLGSGLVK